jgi:mRNA interferase MazF
MKLRQYQIVIVNLDPTVGSEIKKARPCVIISPAEINENLKTIAIAPITSTKRNYPTRVKASINNKDARIAIDQIRTIDKKRIIDVIGDLKTKEVREVKSIIKRTFVDE